MTPLVWRWVRISYNGVGTFYREHAFWEDAAPFSACGRVPRAQVTIEPGVPHAQRPRCRLCARVEADLASPRAGS